MAKKTVIEDTPIVQIDPTLVPRSVVNFMHFGEQVNRVRGGAGLLGFLVVGILSYRHSHSLVIATQHALIAALIAHMAAWIIWLLIAKSMRKDAIADLTRLRDEGLPGEEES
jgi:hypothetical protein